MFEGKALKIAFIISLACHCLILGIPGFNSHVIPDERSKDITVRIDIEKAQLLSKIDVIGEEKKFKKSVKKESYKPKQETEHAEKPQPKEEKIVEEQEPRKQIEKIHVEEPISEPSKEIVEADNSQDQAMLRYQDMVKQIIESRRRYPMWARKQGFEGIVCLIFVILSNGQVEDIEVVHSSGFNILDREAVSTVRRATPFPPFPQKISDSCVQMEVSLVFILR